MTTREMAEQIYVRLVVAACTVDEEVEVEVGDLAQMAWLAAQAWAAQGPVTPVGEEASA